MSIKIKTRPHSGGSKFGRKIVFMGKRSLKDKAMAVIHYMSGKERITKKSFPDQEFINEQRISLSVHTGTHLDAPSHFGTRCEGKRPKTIDEIPLEWCYGNGVVLNFCNKGPCEEISVEDTGNAYLKFSASLYNTFGTMWSHYINSMLMLPHLLPIFHTFYTSLSVYNHCGMDQSVHKDVPV